MSNKTIIKCDFCPKDATRFNETRLKSDGIHREIVSVCDEHMRKMVKENKQHQI